MKGRIISVKEVEGTGEMEGYGYRQIIISIAEPIMPFPPHGYFLKWREMPEQQQPFKDYQMKDFERYERKMKQYHQIMDELDSFHIGDGELTQKGCGEVK